MMAKSTQVLIGAAALIGLSAVGLNAQSFGDRSFTRLNYDTDFVHVQPQKTQAGGYTPLFVLGSDGRLEYLDSSEVTRSQPQGEGSIRQAIGNILRF